MKRIVAIGSTRGHDYSFFLSIVGLFWRHRIGYEPDFFLVGTAQEWEQGHTAVVLDSLEYHGFNFTFIPHIENAEDSTISQSVRQHASAHEMYGPDDLIICSDADLIPFKREFYYTHNVDRYPIGLYYSNAHPGQEMWHWPACHYSMRVKTWREVMKLSDSIVGSLIKTFAEYGLAEKLKAKAVDPAKAWEPCWYTDQLTTSKNIVNSQYFSGQIQFIPREGRPPIDRLDRAFPEVWNKYDINQFTDCHSLRPGWSDGNWERFRPMIEQAFPDSLKWADSYREAFIKVMGCRK